MKRVNFITNIAPNDNGGGMSAVSFSTHAQLKRFFDVNYIGPIQVPAYRTQHIASKLLRKMGLKGNYFFYSDKRLREIARQIDAGINGKKADFNFFHGFTPWSRYESDTPYFGYCDASFATYVRLYNNTNEFSGKDLQRIYDTEKRWLQNARLVFFHSQWALEETKKEYGLNGENFRS